MLGINSDKMQDKEFEKIRLEELKSLMNATIKTSSIISFEGSTIVVGDANHQDIKEAIKYIPQLEPFEISQGAALTYIYPFVSKYDDKHQKDTTASQILDSLKVIGFKSEHIKSLDKEFLEFPGYNPATLNDEIHNDFTEQNLFEVEDIHPDEGIHGELLRNVHHKKLWYILLHPWEKVATSDTEASTKKEDFNYALIYGNEELGYFNKKYGHVLLLVVGVTQDKKNIIGYISHQVCHNLCD